MSLDKSKPFGEVHGHAPYAFEQDGKYFNSQGEEVTENGKLIGRKPNRQIPPSSDPRADLIAKYNKELSVPALQTKLDELEIKFDKKTLKPDLLALLVDDELASQQADANGQD